MAGSICWVSPVHSKTTSGALFAEPADKVFRFFFARIGNCLGSHGPGQFESFRVDIGDQHAATAIGQGVDRPETDQSRPDD